MATYFRRNAWGYASFVIIGVAGLMLRHVPLLLLGLGAGVLLALYRLWWIRRYVHHPDNASFFTVRRYDLTDDVLHGVLDDGTEATQPLASLVRAKREDAYWKLYQSKSASHFIPLSAFASPEDLARFESLLREHGLVHD